ncbi:MAG: SGNH/GDSL hydrolase family protein [Planctomycetota bacterium]|nr:SGNH/GDSL hydrolase family protein [Planctomycetota bacterium]
MDAVTGMLSAGKEPVRIVCFGDSITGAYYHTGGQRAWCDMLGIALQKLHPKAQLQMFNAGISGNTTSAGLKRIERDVIKRKPHLVVVMFGMNDCARRKPKIFAGNLRTILLRCRSGGAAVVLCTPNSIYWEQSRRPREQLEAHAQAARDVAREMSVPLADCYRAYEELRAAKPLEWKLLMSEAIHPSMNGHRLFAEVMAETISGKPVKLGDVPPPLPGLTFTLDLLARGKTVNIIAMPPYDRIFSNSLRKLFPKATFDVTVWPVDGKSLRDLDLWSKQNIQWGKKKRPDLVVTAVPAGAEAADEEAFIRSYNWVLNWSLPFAGKHWDVIAVLPSVAGTLTSEAERARAPLARRVIVGKDIAFIERAEGDKASTESIVTKWIEKQYKAWGAKKQ